VRCVRACDAADEKARPALAAALATTGDVADTRARRVTDRLAAPLGRRGGLRRSSGARRGAGEPQGTAVYSRGGKRAGGEARKALAEQRLPSKQSVTTQTARRQVGAPSLTNAGGLRTAA
jgi:hypothetical protein